MNHGTRGIFTPVLSLCDRTRDIVRRHKMIMSAALVSVTARVRSDFRALTNFRRLPQAAAAQSGTEQKLILEQTRLNLMLGTPECIF